jgi:hypothetical protein
MAEEVMDDIRRSFQATLRRISDRGDRWETHDQDIQYKGTMGGFHAPLRPEK